MIQKARLHGWPKEGIFSYQFVNKHSEKNVLPHEKQAVIDYITAAISNFTYFQNKFFFQDALKCEQDLINNILMASSENTLSLFMRLTYKKNLESAITTSTVYTDLLRWARQHSINVFLLPKQSGLAGKLQLLGYEKCPIGQGTGIYGIEHIL